MSGGWAQRRREAGEAHRRNYTMDPLEGYTCDRCNKRIKGQIYYEDDSGNGRGAWCVDCYREKSRGR